MAKDLQYVSPNEPFEPGAGTWNAFIDAAKYAQSMRGALKPLPSPVQAEKPATALIRNDTGDPLPIFGIVSIGDNIFNPATDESEWQNSIIVEGNLAATAGEPFGVALDTVDENGVGLIATAGLVQCIVEVSDASHGYATTRASSNAKLDSTANPLGAAKIIWKQSGTGTKKAFILLPISSDSASAPITFTPQTATPGTQQDDVAVTSQWFLSTPSINVTYTGFVPANVSSYQILQFFNRSTSNTITINNESGSSSASNRVTVPGGGNLVLLPLTGVTLIYNVATTRWTILEYSPSAYPTALPNGWRFIPGTSGSASTAPNGLIYLPTLTTAGPPTFSVTGPGYVPVPDNVKKKLWLWDGTTALGITAYPGGNATGTSGFMTWTVGSAVSNTTTETTIFTTAPAVVANGVDAEAAISLRLHGSYSTNLGKMRVRLRVGDGTITAPLVFDTTSRTPTIPVTAGQWYLDVIVRIVSTGGSGTCKATGSFTMHDLTGDTVQVWQQDATLFNAAVTIDTTAAMKFDATVEWASADAGNSFELISGFVERTA